jgi:adhesin transport system membrane fusion protein
MSNASTTNLGAQMNETMRGPSMVIWLCGATVLIFLLWAAFAWVDEIVRAEGSMISSSRPQIIQNLEGGILAELAVGEGDIVEKGDVLARLHGTQFQSSVDDLQDQISAFEIRRLRLEAELAGQFDFDVPDEFGQRTPGIVASERALLKARQSDFVSRSDGAKRVLTEAAKERELLENMLKKKIVSLIEVTRAS